MSDLVRTLAVVFRRKGAAEVPAAEFKHALSLDLRWFAPADAKRLVQQAVSVGLVEEAGDLLKARFDVAQVDVPVTFRPTLDVLDEVPEAMPPPSPETRTGPSDPEPSKGPAEVALLEAASASGEDLATLRHEVAEERERWGNLLVEDVAALVVARRRGTDVRTHAARLAARRVDG